ncbi:hypothetical protein QF041_001649 [Paenibacillus sp. W2I17]|nr:hypothetical protein [Paenibacillus sp. W2I17]
MKGFAAVVSNSKRFSAAIRLGQIGQKAVVRNNGISLKLGPLKGWNKYRIAPSLAKKSFRQQWNKLDQELNQEQPALDSSVRSRMEQIIREREEGEGTNHGH